MKIVTVECRNCKKNFYVNTDINDKPACCPFCGEDNIYFTYSYIAEPTYEEEPIL